MTYRHYGSIAYTQWVDPAFCWDVVRSVICVSVCLDVCVLGTRASCAKTAELVELSFGVLTCVDQMDVR